MDPQETAWSSNPKAALNRATDESRTRWSPETRTTLEQKSMHPQVLRAKLDDPIYQVDLGILSLAWSLSSPEFQRR